MTPCPRCGAALPDAARFCPSCGLALGAAEREERRIVTVLFGDLVEFTAFSESRDPEDVKRIIDRAFEGLAEIVTVYGGRVDKILGDEIMAVFGAPQAHEDDPERAVRCALEMQRSLDEYAKELTAERGVTLAMRIGINTGEVVAGAIGGGESYTVVGDAVNVASRLVKAADPGRILVGPATCLATQRSIEYRDIAPLSVKGKAEAVAASEVVGERAAVSGPRASAASPLVGRDPELFVLSSIASIVARDRQPSVVTILGDAGMGKTRVAVEFASRLRDAQVLWGRSLPYGTATPSFAVEEMIRAAFEVSPSDDPAAARKKIADGLASLGMQAETDRIASLAGVREATPAAVPRRSGGAGAVAGPGGGGSPRAGEMSAAVALFEALAAQRRLLVLVFQELHWAEQSLLDLIAEIVERARNVPLLVVALGRPELLERTGAWPVRPGNTTLHLLPLPREAAAELLDALAGNALHPSVRENVLERAGGNPFFIEEFVRLLLDAGERGAASVPVSVQALVAARLDMLPATVRRIAQDAAVAGEQFWPDALVAMDAEASEEAVRDALRALVERELVEPAEQPTLPGREEFRFRQTIVREVAYAALPKQARAQRHAAVGAWLEEVSCACQLEREFYDLVAYHFERAAHSARDVGLEAAAYEEKAREYLERAGDEAMSKDAASAAAAFYERAIEFARSDEDDLHLRVHLGEAFVGCWNPVKAEAHLVHALDASRRLGDRRAEGKTLRLLGDLERLRGDTEPARVHVEQALAIAREQKDALEEAEGLRSHGLLDMLSGRVRAAPLWFRQSLARYREIGDRRGEGWSLQNLGWANLLLGRIDEAIAMLDEGARLFGELEDVEGAGWCMGLRSWALLFQGNLDEADETAKMLIALAGGADDNPVGMGGMGVEIERVLRAIVATERLQFTDAIALATSTFPRFEEVESAWGLAMARYPIGYAHIQRLELSAARAALEDGRRAAAESGDPLVQGLIGSALAYAEIESGNLDEARRLADEARTKTQNAGVEWHTDVSSAWLRGEIALRSGDLAGAERELSVAADRESSSIFAHGRVLWALADVQRLRGDAPAAVETARRAIVVSGSRRADALRARRVLAASLAAAGDHSAALEEADACLAELEPSEWRAECVRVLALRAEILDELGRHDEAAEAHDRARELLGAFPPEADLRPLEAILMR